MFANTIEHTHGDAMNVNHRNKALTAEDLDENAQAPKRARLSKNESGSSSVKQEAGTKRSAREMLDTPPLAALAAGSMPQPKSKAKAAAKKAAAAAAAAAETSAAAVASPGVKAKTLCSS